MNIIEGLCFDDVLLVPQNSKIESRDSIDISVELGKGVKLNGPYISANMKTVTGVLLASNMHKWGMGILHRFDTIENQISNYKDACKIAANYNDNYLNTIGVSIGINSKDDIDALLTETNSKIVCIDVAHGDHAKVLDITEYVAKKYPDSLLIVGNIATGSAAVRLDSAGADVVKVGIGGGALCTTRIETGNGVPQLTALENCYTSLKNKNAKVIADGGLKNSGDCVKALCFSDAVMIGSLLAGTEETPGYIVEVNGIKCKKYEGSSTHKTSRIEGVAGYIPYKGPMDIILQKLKEGLQSGLSYQGCENLEQLKESPQFVKMSVAGLKESQPHANIIR